MPNLHQPLEWSLQARTHPSRTLPPPTPGLAGELLGRCFRIGWQLWLDEPWPERKPLSQHEVTGHRSLSTAAVDVGVFGGWLV